MDLKRRVGTSSIPHGIRHAGYGAVSPVMARSPERAMLSTGGLQLTSGHLTSWETFGQYGSTVGGPRNNGGEQIPLLRMGGVRGG